MTGCRPSYAAEVKGFTPDTAGVPKKRLKMMGRQAQLAFVPLGRRGQMLVWLRRAWLLRAWAHSRRRHAECRCDRTRAGVSCHGACRWPQHGIRRGHVLSRWRPGTVSAVAAAPHSRSVSGARLHRPGCARPFQHDRVRLSRRRTRWAKRFGSSRAAKPMWTRGRHRCTRQSLATLRYRDLGWLSTREDVAPEAVSAPFNQEASGFVSGEGSVCAAIESLEHARNRPAGIYAEVLGYAAANDGADLLMPDRDGSALERATCRCLERAGVTQHDIDVVFAPAPAVPALDRATAAALTRVFGDGRCSTADRDAIAPGSYARGVGGARLCAAIKAINSSRIPATANLRRPIADLQFVTGDACHAPVNKAVAAYGFGGHAASLALSRCGP